MILTQYSKFYRNLEYVMYNVFLTTCPSVLYSTPTKTDEIQPPGGKKAQFTYFCIYEYIQ
jgi:hypothetical protein